MFWANVVCRLFFDLLLSQRQLNMRHIVLRVRVGFKSKGMVLTFRDALSEG